MPDTFPLQFLLATFAGWTNRHLGEIIAYLIEDNRVLKEQVGGKRLRPPTTNAAASQRRDTRSVEPFFRKWLRS